MLSIAGNLSLGGVGLDDRLSECNERLLEHCVCTFALGRLVRRLLLIGIISAISAEIMSVIHRMCKLFGADCAVNRVRGNH